MKTAHLCIAAMSCLLVLGQDGIRPRTSPSDYPAHETNSGVTVAAQTIAPAQVRKIFATDLNKGGYIVVEVGIYPENGKTVDLSPADFMLKIGSDATLLRAADGHAIASMLRDKYTPPKPRPHIPDVYTTTEIGYESGGYDPVTGRRTHGVYAATGVGVATGGPPGPQPPAPGSTDWDQDVMQRELEAKGLPEGKVTQAAAGYLYFPKPGGKNRNSGYQLSWSGDNATVRLTLPPPK